MRALRDIETDVLLAMDFPGLSDIDNADRCGKLLREYQKALIAEARRVALEDAARVAENPNCMTSGVSPLDEWCKGCAKAIRALLPSEVKP